jgi:hypothetical protein
MRECDKVAGRKLGYPTLANGRSEPLQMEEITMTIIKSTKVTKQEPFRGLLEDPGYQPREDSLCIRALKFSDQLEMLALGIPVQSHRFDAPALKGAFTPGTSNHSALKDLLGRTWRMTVGLGLDCGGGVCATVRLYSDEPQTRPGKDPFALIEVRFADEFAGFKVKTDPEHIRDLDRTYDL